MTGKSLANFSKMPSHSNFHMDEHHRGVPNYLKTLFSVTELCCLDDVRMRMHLIPYRKGKVFSHNLAFLCPLTMKNTFK